MTDNDLQEQVNRIITIVCLYYEVPMDTLKADRKEKNVKCRYVCWELLRECLNVSSAYIARVFEKEGSTVRGARKYIDDMTFPGITKEVEELKVHINSKSPGVSLIYPKLERMSNEFNNMVRIIESLNHGSR